MILDVNLPPSSGWTDQFQNAGRVDNHGIELTFDVNPVQRDRFSWSVNTQYSRNRSCVKELARAELDDDGTDIDAAYGGAAGAVYLEASGFPQLSDQYHIAGDPNPSWMGS